MKTLKPLLLIFITLLVCNAGNAQSDAAIRLENNKFYISYIQDYIEAMKVNTDSVKILQLLDQMTAMAKEVSMELDKIVIEEVPTQETQPDTTIIPETENNQDYEWPDYDNNNGGNDNGKQDDGFTLPGMDIFKKRINTGLLFQFGLNAWRNPNETVNTPTPELSAGRSWFWEFGILRKIKLSKSNKNSQFVYGLTYQSNSFRLQNDLRLTEVNKNPQFIQETGLRTDPSLTIGYLTVPVGFRWNISGKFKLEAGAYAGYRVRSVQHLSRKNGDETSHEMLSGNWRLNDWMYGVNGGIGMGIFNLIVKYNMSNMFRDNPSYDFRTFMLGTSIRLF